MTGYRLGKKPKRDITQEGSTPKIEEHVLRRKANGPDDIAAIHRYMSARTLQAITADLDCHPSLIKLYERRYGVRAMRQCRKCREAFPYSEMHQTASNHAITCIGCHESAKAEPRLKGTALESVEYTSIPSIVYQSCRWRMSSAEGINGWSRPQMVFG